MVGICFYFQVHQPYRLRRDFDFFAIGTDRPHEDDDKNAAIARKVADRCYLPTNQLMLELIERFQGRFRISYSISGTALDQFEQYCPEVLDSFRRLATTGCVEFLAETYYHSLAFLFSPAEFRRQVKMHQEKIRTLFGKKPTVFRNTELIYSNQVGRTAEKMGFKAVIAEGVDRHLEWRSPNFLYKPAECTKIKLLLKNYKLSDDIAFRFSNRSWEEWPLTAEKYSRWLHQIAGNGDVINLFMDYETFGEHQWEESGIFAFLRQLPDQLLAHPDFEFVTPSQACAKYPARAQLDYPHITSWADLERDTSAWLGNPLQDSAAESVFRLEKDVLATKDQELIHVWRKLQTSDHFYYMCIKWFQDGDVHKYFNPYDSPYDAFIIYVNALNQLRWATTQALQKAADERRIRKRSAGTSKRDIAAIPPSPQFPIEPAVANRPSLDHF